MTNFFHSIVVKVAIGLMALASLLSPPVAGSFTPAEGTQWVISQTVLPTDATINLTSFATPDGRKYTMSNFGYIGYATLDPLNSARIETISFTGITQNANNSATLTGVSRGLDFIAPYSASSTLAHVHLVGSNMILSNPAAFYGNEFLFANNIGTSTAILTFSSTTPPRYDSVAAQASGTYIATTSEFASITYVNKVSAQGCATATEGVVGCSELASQVKMASSTFNPGTPTVLYTNYSTSSPQTKGLWIPITQNDGTLNPNFISTSSNYLWSGINTFTGGINASSTSNNFIASSTQYVENVGIINATSTIKINGNPVGLQKYSAVSLTSTTTTGFSTSTLITIPAGVMNASSTIEVRGGVNCGVDNSVSCKFYLRDGTGSQFGTFSVSHVSSGNLGVLPGTFSFQIIPNNSVSSQNTTYQCSAIGLDNPGAAPELNGCSGSGNSQSTINLANAFTLNMVMNGGGITATLSNLTVIVNP